MAKDLVKLKVMREIDPRLNRPFVKRTGAHIGRDAGRIAEAGALLQVVPKQRIRPFHAPTGRELKVGNNLEPSSAARNRIAIKSGEGRLRRRRERVVLHDRG